MSSKLRVGIVGASGWMAGALAAGVEYDDHGYEPATGVGNKNGLSVVGGLCDLNKSAMESRKKELSLDGAQLYTSYREMITSENIDAVIVAIPNNLHALFARQALEAGKHVFLEKPLSTTREDSKLLLEAASQSKATTKVDYILVHYDEQERLRDLVAQEAFGELVSTHFTYRHPIQVAQSAEQAWKLSKEKTGGAIPMGICHAISLTAFQVDSDPATVIAMSCKPRIRKFDYDTQYDIMVTFENGVVSLIQGNIDFAEKYDARHTLIGTGGQFDYNPFVPVQDRVAWSSQKLDRPYSTDSGFAQHHLDSGDVWKHQCGRTVAEFVAHAVKNEKDPLLGFESPLVRRVEAIIWAADISGQNGSEPVKIRNCSIDG